MRARAVLIPRVRAAPYQECVTSLVWIAGAIAALLFIYLVIALCAPERLE